MKLETPYEIGMINLVSKLKLANIAAFAELVQIWKTNDRRGGEQ